MDPLNTKLIGLSDFLAFFRQDQAKQDVTQQTIVAKFPALPVDVPQLPDAYRARVATEKQIADLLVGNIKSKSHLISAIGMGGVGKSCIKAAVVRTEQVREAFPDGIGWVGLVSRTIIVC